MAAKLPALTRANFPLHQKLPKKVASKIAMKIVRVNKPLS